MTHGFSNRVWCDTATLGTGNVTIGAPRGAHCTPAAAGTPNGADRTWLLEEGDDFELFRGAYTTAGTVVTRGTVLLSQIAGVTGTTRMTLAGAATIRQVAAAEDLLSIVSPADARGVIEAAKSGANSDITSLTGLPAWTAYTPSVVAGVGAFGSASGTGRYTQIGKTVFFSLAATITNNGTGSGYVIVTLPVAAKDKFIFFGREDAVTGNPLQAKSAAASTSVNVFTLSNTYPGGTGYLLVLSGSYEAN